MHPSKYSKGKKPELVVKHIQYNRKQHWGGGGGAGEGGEGLA